MDIFTTDNTDDWDGKNCTRTECWHHLYEKYPPYPAILARNLSKFSRVTL